ncbi:MAG: MBL fold metallo-hydrolase [Streptosporangiaceae bacterium]|jgi:glyoxylase-like metal-dependent hydrolase (beta-lactamase superfamily II)
MAPGELIITGTRQREAWLERVMPPVERLDAGLWSIPVPIPDNPLRFVSVYAFGTGEGLVLIDAGWGSDESWRTLTDGLESIGAGIADVRGVLVTHLHYDHIGLAGRIRQAGGAWIALHPADHAVLSLPDYRRAELAVAREADFLYGLGATPAEAAAAVGSAADWEKFAGMALPDRLLEDGELADVPGWKLRALHTPGHTPGHLCFVDERSRRLFSGDHVLPRITPNISAQRGDPGSPLLSYLDSLARTRDLDVDEVLPAHEWRFTGLAARVDAITAHHERRLAELLAAVRRHPGSTPWLLAGELTWSRPWNQYGGQMRIFAVTETAAHLDLLEHRGLVTASSTRPPGYTVTAT